MNANELLAGGSPVQRLRWMGASVLSNEELLEILLGVENGRPYLKGIQKLSDVLVVSPDRPGLQPRQRDILAAAIELGRRAKYSPDDEPPKFTSPATVADYCMAAFGMSDLDQEQLWVLILNTKHQLKAAKMIYQGMAHGITVRNSEVLRPAVLYNATAMVIAHNHPSGDPAPSTEDVNMTKALQEAAALLGIELLDHVIIGNYRYVSLMERGLMKPSSK